MENKFITTIKFDEPREAKVSLQNDKLVISGVSFEQYHDQDCYEHVYADFDVIKYYKEDIEKFGNIGKIEIKSVEDCGFIIFIYSENRYTEDRIGVLINCYNENNGYYSSDLELIVKDGEKLVGKFDLEKYNIID